MSDSPGLTGLSDEAPSSAERALAAEALLRDNPDEIAVLASQASQWYRSQGLSIPFATVIKDYWVTEVLRCLSEPLIATQQAANNPLVHARVVFKGGTSLSKGHRLLERFSEDIDLYIDAYEVDESGSIRLGGTAIGGKRIDRLMKAAAERISATLGLEYTTFPNQKAGFKRGYTFVYDKGASPSEGSSQRLKSGVQVELVRMGHPTPSTRLQLSSYIAEWASHAGIFGLQEYADTRPVIIDVLAPERTLVDKLCILHDQAIAVQAGQAGQLRRQARHYYDVHQLLTARFVIQNLYAKPTMVAEYAEEAAKASDRARRPGKPRPESGFATSPAFCDEAVLEYARAEYNDEMEALSYGTVPSFDDVIAVVRRSALLL